MLLDLRGICNNLGRREIVGTICRICQREIERERGGERTNTFPPSSFALRVTIREPSQTMTKTPVKIGRDCSGGAVIDHQPSFQQSLEVNLPFIESKTASAKQNCSAQPSVIIPSARNAIERTIKGPHKSQSFKTAFSAVGFKTCTILIPIARKSLIYASNQQFPHLELEIRTIVTETGSSSVSVPVYLARWSHQPSVSLNENKTNLVSV